LALAAIPAALHAQPVIRLHQVAVLDPGWTADGSDALDGGSAVALDARGRFIVAGGRTGDRFAVFDSAGSFVRYVGRRGDGPGEFIRITSLVATERYIHIFDAGTGRRTMLNLDFAVARTDAIPGGVLSAFPLPGDRVVFYADIPLRNAVGEPIHILEPDGSMESFGAVGGSYRAGSIPMATLGPGAAGRAWTVEALQYVVTSWSIPDRQRIWIRRVDASWFDGDSDPGAWPRPALHGIGEAGGALWVVGVKPEPEWAGKVKNGPLPQIPATQLVDGVLDALDSRTLEPIAHGEWDEGFMNGGFVPGTNLLIRIQENQVGYVSLALLRPELAFGESPSSFLPRRSVNNDNTSIRTSVAHPKR
jgi:6-bladed beta-propeller